MLSRSQLSAFLCCWPHSFLLQMAFFRQQWKMKYKQLWLLWLQNLVLSFADLASWSDQEQELMGFREANYANDTALPESQDVGKLIYSGHFRSRLPVGGTCLAANYPPYPLLRLKLPCKAVRAFWIEPSPTPPIPGRIPRGLLCFFHSLKAAWACSVRAAWHSTPLFIHSTSLWRTYCIRHILWPQLAHGVVGETNEKTVNSNTEQLKILLKPSTTESGKCSTWWGSGPF